MTISIGGIGSYPDSLWMDNKSVSDCLGLFVCRRSINIFLALLF